MVGTQIDHKQVTALSSSNVEWDGIKLSIIQDVRRSVLSRDGAETANQSPAFTRT